MNIERIMRFLRFQPELGQQGHGLKLFQIIFSNKNKNSILLNRFLCTWKALIHSTLISEIKDTKSHVSWAHAKIPNKIVLKCHFELKFNNFQKKERERLQLIATIFSPLELT